MTKAKAAVIGSGNMGRHHIRILGAMPDIEFIGVIDPDIERALPHAKAVGAPVLTTLDDLPEIDLAVIATPTAYHTETALTLIGRGVHLLIEKPLADTVKDAERLVDAAERASTQLAVGHVERFNAAISVLAGLAESPIMLSFERLSPYTPRIKDSVVFDLMVHDLDLACWIADGFPTHIEAVGAKVFSDTVDVASAVLGFESGCIASLQASRATQDKVRHISVAERSRFIVADTMRQEISIKRETTVEFGEHGMYRQANMTEVPYIDRSGEPLARELRNFVDAVIGKAEPLVTGRDGLAAIRLAHAVEQAITQAPPA